jgi:hypothetical protein
MMGPMDPERQRLEEDRAGVTDWKRWGPYLSERAWGTVREDYSPDGDAWTYFPHDHARSRAYRWGEDGLGGISDRDQRLCFALALWNGRDPILKERLYGLTGPQGNHGEDVKEYYHYLDSTPTHSYMRFLYRYPQAPFPYERLEAENRRRGYDDPEYELIDTGVFDLDRYFDVTMEYAKASPEDVLVLVSATNRGPDAARLELLPTLWFRNTWAWGRDDRRPEWYLHPNGQMPAYEWSFSAVNPPVHAWACWRVYQIDRRYRGEADTEFLERVFQKLLLNFTWWVNRKDAEGNNIFQGGFMGLDNIGVFDHSQPLPRGGHLEQSDSTAWMAMYCLNMLTIALELALTRPAYEDMASKFFEHFLHIADAMNHIGEADVPLWDETDGWFYNVAHLPGAEAFPLKVRSIVGLIALFAVDTLEPETLERLPGFRRRMDWFLRDRPDLCRNVAEMHVPGMGRRRLLSVLGAEQLRRVLGRVLDETEFLSPHGIRSLSARHGAEPYILHLDGQEYRVAYEPGESRSGIFGGNSNWRGPVWFPINYLAIESLQKFFHYHGPDFTVECPAGSGRMLDLWEVAAEISRRLIGIFLRDGNGARPAFTHDRFRRDPLWQDHLLFHEYFHGDTGAGLGASQQTGWTGLVAKLIQQMGVPPSESVGG